MYVVDAKRQVKRKMRFIIMFVAAVCFKWPKSKNIYDVLLASVNGPGDFKYERWLLIKKIRIDEFVR